MRPINYSANGLSVMAYHAIRNQDNSTTEHAAMVALASVQNGKKFDGTTDADVLLLVCPTCGATAYVPLCGDQDAQEFHSRVRNARTNPSPLTTARQSVIADVKARGGIPLITISGIQ